VDKRRHLLAFNSGDLAFQEIITSRPYRDSDRPSRRYFRFPDNRQVAPIN
jgi:hypothetical protein